MNSSGDGTYWAVVWDKFREGDRRAFEIIYNEYVDTLFAYGSRLTPHRALLEDAVQDLFLDVYTYAKRLRKPESLEFYLYKSLKRIIIKKTTERYRFTHPEDFKEQFDLVFPIEEFPEDLLEENLEMLQKELKALDSGKRELLYLRFNSGLTYKEIGLLVNEKTDTVKKQVSRLLKQLQSKMNVTNLGLLAIFKRR